MSENAVQAAEQAKTARERFIENNQVIAYLAEKFPLCFIAEGEAKPLKVGIFQDLVDSLAGDERVTKTQLRRALRQYTASMRYLYGYKVGAVRVDLQGNSCGELSAEHIEHAAQQLAQTKAKIAERKAALSKGKKRENKAENHQGAKATGQRKNNATKSARVNRKPQLKLAPLSLAELTKMQQVKVQAAGKTQLATVLEVGRDAARVELVNGLVINVTEDRLFKAE